jgi:hypothetical protein
VLKRAPQLSIVPLGAEQHLEERTYAAMTKPPLANAPLPLLLTQGSPFLNEPRWDMRLKHVGYRTKSCCLYYILRFIRFHGNS